MRSRRSKLALATCLLWLVAIEVLPNLHLAFHDDHHTHDGPMITVTFDVAPHEHDANGRDVEPGRGSLRGERTISVPLHHHNGDGLAHHAQAIASPPPPILAPLSIARVETRVTHAAISHWNAARSSRPNARGPPAYAAN